MNASVCIWGGKNLTTKVDLEPNAHSIFFFQGSEGSDPCRVFMEPDQMLTLLEQLNQVAETLKGELKAEGVAA